MLIFELFKIIICILVILNCFLIKSECNKASTKDWLFQQWMEETEDGYRYLIKWNHDFNKGLIKFRAEIKTKVWASFGLLDSNGNTDLVIVWINKDGSATIKDCTLRNDSKLVLDESQDWDLLWAEQNETHIAFEFSRNLITCDTNDFKITNISSEIVVYSYGENSISGFDDFSEFNIKGKKKMQLILPNYESKDKMDPIFMTINATLPDNKLSVYLCKIYKIENPVHIIEVDTVVSDKSSVHHIALFHCAGHDPAKLDAYLQKEYFECAPTMGLHEDLRNCIKQTLVWAIGAGPMPSNPESAWVLGKEHKYYLFQNHYTNINLEKNLRIDAGFKLFPSSKQRKYALSDANIGGKPVNAFLIPPRKMNFIVANHCTVDCFLSKNTEPKFIKIISALPHMHLAGKKLRLRHFRNGKELPWISNEENFVFDSQIKYYFLEPIIIEPGDVLTTECTYNTMTRNLTTISGELTDFEMCTVTITFYPRIEDSLTACFSRMSEKTIKDITGIEDIDGFGKSNDSKIVSTTCGETSLNKYLTNKVDWSESLENKLRFSPQVSECFMGDTETNQTENYISYPNVSNIYKPEFSCSKN